MKALDLQAQMKRYCNQGTVLPDDIRKQIESRGQRVLLYAWIDVSPRAWIVLSNVAFWVCADRVNAYPLETLAKLEDSNLLSSNLLLVRDKRGLLLERFQYTHRQRHAVASVQIVLNDHLEGKRALDLDEAKANERYQNAVLDSLFKAQSLVANNDSALLFRLLAYMKPYKAKVLWGIFGAALFTLVSLVPSWMTGVVIDEIVVPFQQGELSFEIAKRWGWLAVGALALVYLLREFFIWLRLRTMAVVGEYVATDLRRDLYSHMQKLGVDFFSEKPTGTLISRVTSDTDRLWDFVAFGIIEVFVSILMLVGIGTALVILDWRLGLVMIVPVPLFLYAIYWHGEKMQKIFLRIWRKWSTMTGLVSDTLPGMKVVKVFNRGHYEKTRFETKNKEVLEEAESLHQMWTSFWPKLMFAVQCASVLVWAFALPRLLGDPQGAGSVARLSVGTFVSFMLYAGMYMQPVEIIGQMARMMNRALSSAHRVFEILDTRPSTKLCGLNHKAEIKGELELRDLRFSYDGVRQVLKGLNLSISAGQMVGLVGPSGSGKSTLVQLLVRFFDASGGEIRLDGVRLEDWDLDVYRKQVGMVLQEPYLFHGSIVDNIRYGRPEASHREVLEAARAANAHDFIMKLPEGYDSLVGERGHSLSGGERQRVSIARAILQDPKILILDEATSAVDTETERRIQQALDRLVKGRTVIAIAHRLSTLANADLIVCMKDGEIHEVGKQAELLEKKDGLYRKLHRLQVELQGLA